MKSKPAILILSLAVAFVSLTSYLLVCETSRPSNGGDGVPFTTIAEGSSSGYRRGDMSYAGEYKVIRNQSEWESFWFNHTSGRYPQPPAPTDISWNSQMVLVALQGNWRNCCESYIRFVDAEVEGDTLYAHVESVQRDGMLQAESNPFHIVVLESMPNVVFTETP